MLLFIQDNFHCLYVTIIRYSFKTKTPTPVWNWRFCFIQSATWTHFHFTNLVLLGHGNIAIKLRLGSFLAANQRHIFLDYKSLKFPLPLFILSFPLFISFYNSIESGIRHTTSFHCFYSSNFFLFPFLICLNELICYFRSWPSKIFPLFFCKINSFSLSCFDFCSFFFR